MTAPVDYERIAHVYDHDEIRRKDVDPHLASFVAERGENVRVLDIACGTGTQLVADVARFPTLRAIGVDRSAGMLAQARRKSGAIRWVRADGSALPLADASIDYASIQFAIHHFANGARAVTEARRVLAPGARFAVITIDPREQPGFAIYRYWPSTLEMDLRRFVPPDELVEWCRTAGFGDAQVSARMVRPELRLEQALTLARDRSSSQLALISDGEHRAGIERIEAEIKDLGPDAIVHDEIRLVTLVATA